MPRFDGTGPMGQGSMTGRGFGPCVRGMGCGYRRFYTEKEESEMLSEEAKALEQELKAIKERLNEFKVESRRRLGFPSFL